MKSRLLLWILLTASVITFGTYSCIKAPVVTYGFASYYTFSRIMLEEKDISMAYDSAYFHSKIKAYGIENIYDMANIPPGSFVFIPIAWLEPQCAKEIWTALLVIMMFISVYILFNAFELKYNSVTGLVLLSVCFLFYPAYNNVALGQIYILILLLFSISIYGLKRGNIWLVSLPLAAIILIKGYGIIPLIFLAAFKKWKEFAATLAVVGAIFMLTLPLITPDVWGIYLQKVFIGVGFNGFASGVQYQTINSLIRHVFLFDSIYNPHSLFKLSESFVSTVVFIISMFIVLYVIVKHHKENIFPLFIMAVSLNVILAPVAEEYHYILFLPLILVLAKILFDDTAGVNSFRSRHIVFVIAVIIMALPLDYRSLQNSAFPAYLLAYPKLYAGITLLIVFLSNNLKMPELNNRMAN